MPRLVTLHAAAQLTPAVQGSFAGLCGLYSIINGLRLAVHPVRRMHGNEARHLFGVGVQMLHEWRRLPTTLLTGLPEGRWMLLCDHLIKEATIRTGLRLRRRHIFKDLRFNQFDLACQRIARCLEQQTPVLIIAWGAYDHFTVVSGISDKRLMLFDSAGLSWVYLESCALQRARSQSRHRISRRSAMVIECIR